MWEQQSQTKRSLRQWPPAVVVLRLLPVVSLATGQQAFSKPTCMVRAMIDRRVCHTPTPAFQWSQPFDIATYRTSLAQQTSSTGQHIFCPSPDFRWHLPGSAPRHRRHDGYHFASSNPWPIWGPRKLSATTPSLLHATPSQRSDSHKLYRRRQPTSHPFPERGWVISDLKRARSMLIKALPHMFHYLDDPAIPTTTNGLEGYFARLKNHYRHHRGLAITLRPNYFAWYFHLKSR